MMIAFRTRVAFVASCAAVLAVQAAGQDPSNDAVEERLRHMQTEIDNLRGDNASMRGELDELRARTGDNWLSEERADEIRSLVADVLADADMRSSLTGDGMTAGWNEHFFLASPDGRFKLQLDGEVQFRWMYNYHDAQDRHVQGFEIPRTKMTFSGHVFSRDIQYLVRTDITHNEVGIIPGLGFLKDAWVRFSLNNEWSVRLGQYKMPFMREELIASSRQLAVERSLINENLSIDRSQGIEFVYLSDRDKWSFMLADAGRDQVGGFNLTAQSDGGAANPNNPPNTPVINSSGLPKIDSEIAIAFRHEHLFAGEWEQFQDFTSRPDDEYGVMIGVAGFYQKSERGITNSFGTSPAFRTETEWLAWTADLSIEWGGANAFIAVSHHYIDSPSNNFNIWGVVMQGGMYLTKRVEAFARFEYGWWDFSPNSFHDLNVLTIGTNYYIDGHDLKWTTDFGYGISKIESAWDSQIAGYRPEGDDVEPQIVFRTQLQLLF